MDPIQPWIDADEMRQLAEKLMEPKSQPTPNIPDTGFGDGFEGFAGVPTLNTSPALNQRPSDKPTNVPQPLAELTTPASQPPPTAQAEAPVTPAAQPEANSAPPKPESDQDTVIERGDPNLQKSAQELHQRLESQHKADGIFILNRAGEILYGKNNHVRLQFIARNLIQLASRKGAPSGNVHIKVGPSRILEIISTESADDGLIIGMIVPEPLVGEARKKISQQMSGMHISRARS